MRVATGAGLTDPDNTLAAAAHVMSVEPAVQLQSDADAHSNSNENDTVNGGGDSQQLIIARTEPGDSDTIEQLPTGEHPQAGPTPSRHKQTKGWTLTNNKELR